MSTCPTDIYDASAVLERALANEALAAFHNSDTRKVCKVEFSDDWFVMDERTYDGESVTLFETPLEAVMHWYEENVLAVVA